jgi:hypothetical protein
MKSTSLIWCILLLSCNSCQKIRFSDDELQLEKKNYTGNKLRIDGYYYRESQTSRGQIGNPPARRSAMSLS